MAWQSIVDIARRRAAEGPDDRAFGQWDDDSVEAWLTYGRLDERARAIAAALSRTVAAEERALLIYPPGFLYIEAFFGCLYAGVISVPAYPPEPSRLDRTLPRLQAIIDDAQAGTVLTTRAILDAIAPIVAHVPALARLRWLATDELVETGGFRAPRLAPDRIAFLQYTSGSTGAPKGVKLTHANLVDNSEAIRRAHGYSRDSRMVTWLPPYHDMGLIGSILQPVFTGFPCVTMSPVSFLLRPVRWLQAISTTRATTSGAPNFAFDLAARRVSAEQRASLDLSSWELAYCGAEPVRRETLRRFADSFRECGFRAQAFYPCYGLAEATLIVSGGKQRDLAASTVVSLGPSVTSGEIAIVDPRTRARLADGIEGEIWLRGPSVAAGYWNRPVESQAVFGARLASGDGPFVRTGDLGFLQRGELFVTGRLKELIIIRGRKLAPSDVEATVERAERGGLRAGGSVAISSPVDGEERLFVVVELERRQRERRASTAPAHERRRGGDRRQRPFAYRGSTGDVPATIDDLVRAIRNAVAAEHGVEVFGVVLVRPRGIPKTSSGKKQRLACRAFVTGRSADILHVWRADQPLARPETSQHVA
jgi:acyl-CoA synthetase (AMP-forming)/AMP-acid ligase II